MGRPGWLADNERRMYPLQEGEPLTFSLDPLALSPTPDVVLPPEAIVDFGCVVGPGVLETYDPIVATADRAQRTMYLQALSRSGDTLRFHFMLVPSSSPGYVGLTTLDLELRFELPADAPEFAFAETRARLRLDVDDPDPLTRPPVRPGREDWLAFEGYLVAGRLDTLAAQLADGQTVYGYGPRGLPPRVEPGCVRDLGRQFFLGFLTANYPRTLATPADGYSESSESSDSPAGERVAVVNARIGFAVGEAEPDGSPGAGLPFPIPVAAGYGISVRQSTSQNRLTLTATPAGGAGFPCADVPFYEGEQPPEGSVLLSGGPACNEVLHGVNGASAELIRWSGGPGVRIEVDPDDETALVLDFTVAAARGAVT